MDQNEQVSGIKRRRWRNMFVQPLGQIRLIFLFPMLGLAGVDALLGILRAMLLNCVAGLQAAYPTNAAALAEVNDSVRALFFYGILIVGICAIALAICGVIISHRYYGPLVPLLRAVKGMAQGDFGQRVHLRKNDELKELADAVNALSESLGRAPSEVAP